MRFLVRGALVAVRVGLGLVALALALLLAALIALHTDWGRNRVLSVALGELSSVLAGRASVGRLEGDLTGGTLILYDAEIDDSDGQPAIRAHRVEVRYGLPGLLFGSRHVDAVRVEGAWLRMGQLADGRFNLAALGMEKPASQKQEIVKPSTAAPVEFTIRHILVDGLARYEPPTERPELRLLEGTIHVEGRLGIGAAVVITVHRVDVGLVTPSLAALTAGGVVDIHGGHVWLRQVSVALGFDGAALHRLVPEAHARGPFHLHLDADGQTNGLTVALRLHFARGHLTLDGRLGIPGDHFTWQGALAIADLDPAAVYAGVPHALVALEASGSGNDGNGNVRLARLVASAAGAHLRASGHSDFKGFGELSAEVEVRDLMRLRTYGAPALAGQLSATARVVRSSRALTLDGDVHVAALVVPSLRIDHLDAHVATVDVSGDATISARGISAATIRLEKLSLNAHGDRKAVTLKLDSEGPRATRLALSAQGTPLFRAGRPIGADALVQGILFMTHGRVWNTAGPFALHAEPDLVRVTGFHLASGVQTITVDGDWRRGGAVAGALHADRLDARELEPIIAPGHRLPETDIHLNAQARGTTRAPIIDCEIGGKSRPDEATGLLQIEGDLTAHYAAGRVRGVLGASIAGQSIAVHADLPTTAREGRAPLDVAAKFGVLFDPILGGFLLPALTDLMPLSLRSLQGKINGEATLSGTVGAPRLATSFHVGAWGSSPIKGSADAALSYGDALLSATVGARLSSLPAGGGSGGGTVDAQLSSRIDLGSIVVLPERLAHGLLAATVTASVRAKAVDLSVVPWDALGIDLPGAAGRVDGNVSLTGTLGAPVLRANFDGRGLAGPHVDHAEISLALEFQRRLAHLGASVSLRGAPLLHLHGSAPIDPARIAHVREIPLHLDGEIPLFPLANVPELGSEIGGALAATFAVRGTIGRPEGHLTIDGKSLRIGRAGFSRFAVDAGFDGAVATVALDAKQTAGRLRLHATIPILAAQPWSIAARADDFLLDFESATLPLLRTARGEMNADLKVGGTRALPRIEGSVRLEHGELALSRSPMLYHDLSLDLGFADGHVTLRHFDLAAAGGTLKLVGEGRLDGLEWNRLDGHAVLARLPLREGGIDALIDANADFHALRKAGTLRGEVIVHDGFARLAELTARRALQSTGTPTDVVYVDAIGRRAERALVRADALFRLEQPAFGRLGEKGYADDAAFTLSVPGPFLVRGGEVNAEVSGKIELDLLGNATKVGGTVESQHGTIVLFSRAWDLDHARVLFDGTTTIDPALEVRLTRAEGDATIVVEVHGSAAHPEVVFTSVPPVYSESQIVALIVSGDSEIMQLSDQSLDRQVVGALSRAIVGALKDQLVARLPIEVMKVSRERNLDGMAESPIEVGRFIGAGIYASYVHQFIGANPRLLNQNQLQVDYRLARGIELQSQFGDAGAGALDLFWTHRF